MPRNSPPRKPPLTTNLLIRLDAPLKEWILANGGSEMVRSVMRALKEAQE